MNTDKTTFLTLLLLLLFLKNTRRSGEATQEVFSPNILEMSLVIWIESRVEPREAPSWFRSGLSHLPFQPPWQLNASSNQKPSVRAGVRLPGTGGTLRRLTPNNVTSEPIESTGVSVILLLRQHWRHSACMWHIQAKQEKCGKNTHNAIGPLHPVTRTQKAGQTMNSNWV